MPELIASDLVRRAKLTITAIVVTVSLLIVGLWAAAFTPAHEHILMVGAIAAAATLIQAGLAAFLILEIRRSTTKETALADEHAKLDRIQQIAGIGSIEVDIVTGLVNWSPVACAIFGVDSNTVEPTVEYILNFVHGDDRTTVAKAAAESRALGVAASPLEYRIVRPDGAVRIVHREYDMQYDPEGRAIRRIMTFQDITQLKATEIRLRQSMEHLDRVQRIARIGSISQDVATGENTWSPGACAIFGVDSKTVEPSVEYIRRFFHPDDRAKIAEAASDSHLQGAPSPLEYRIIRPDGTERTVYREHDWELATDGSPVRRIITFKDITDLKATEIRLRQSMEDLDRVQRIAGIGSTTEELATGEYTWSPGACAIFGVDQDAVEPTVEYMRRFYHPSDRAKIAEAAEQARLTGAPAPSLEYRIVRPDGAVRWVYRENDMQLDREGRAVRRIVTFKDITDLKAKETQLHDAMDHLNRVQRIAGIGSLEIDLTTETERIGWSPHACKLFGVDPASVEPTPAYLLNRIHPDDRDKARSASDRANSTGTAAPPLEYRIVRPDGEERVLYRENAIQYGDSGEPARRIVTYKDITEIKITEAQLRQAQDDLNRAQRLAKVGSDAWDLANR